MKYSLIFLLHQATAMAQLIPAHDPVLIKQDSVYYMFCTGLPAFKGHTWAPDISYHNGQYYLYYAVSAFGRNTSCIGVATNKTLHPGSPGYHWEDRGKLVQSVPNCDVWNAIDPNLFVDDNDSAWLTFGSFWG